MGSTLKSGVLQQATKHLLLLKTVQKLGADQGRFWRLLLSEPSPINTSHLHKGEEITFWCSEPPGTTHGYDSPEQLMQLRILQHILL